MILKRLINPITCSFNTRWLEILQLKALSSLVSGFFLVFFFGRTELAWILVIPRYPVSVSSSVSGLTHTFDSLKSLKSCAFPFVKAVQMICLSCLLTTTWVFIVCLFFFPEYHFRCPFLGAPPVFRLRQSEQLQIPYHFLAEPSVPAVKMSHP